MSLTVYCGPMFSGKTTRMVQEITKYSDIVSESPRHRPLIINHASDNRHDLSLRENNSDFIGVNSRKGLISSHSSLYKGLGNNVDVISVNELEKVDVSMYSVIGVDECQFFPDLYLMVQNWLKQKKHIICAGLDGNFKMGAFGQVYLLLSIADEFTKLRAICKKCLDEAIARKEVITPNTMIPAPFTDKIVDKDKNKNENEIDVGGKEKYVAVCRKHHSCGSF